MTPDQWLDLQEQLWSAFGPLVSWWLSFLMAGLLAAVVMTSTAVYFSDWTSGS